MSATPSAPPSASATTSVRTAADGQALIRIEIDDTIARIALARPHKRNALSDPLVLALREAFETLPASVRAVVLHADGPQFCAGLDLSEMVEHDVPGGVAHSRMWHSAFETIQFGRVPVVAALRGAVIGGGLELAASCHIRVAEPTAFYALPEGSRGLFTGGGGSVRISRLIGPDRLTEMMLTGRTYSGEEGERLGLAHHLVPEGTGLDKAFELAERIARNSPTINAFVIQAIAQIGTMPPEAGLYAESLTAALSQTGPDAEEGLRAFLEKRAPVFRS